MHVRTEVVSIDREKKTVRVRDLENGNAERDVAYDNLVLSPGAKAFIPPPFAGTEPHPSIRTLRNLEDMDAIIDALPRPHPEEDELGTERKRVVVVGGGYIGLEVAEALNHRGGGEDIAVTIVEFAPQLMGVADPEMTAPLLDELVGRGVDVRLGTKVESFKTYEEDKLVTVRW